MQITFPSREKHEVLFYVTPLDSSCSVVLGHNWLTRYTLSIDWVLGNILFEATPHVPKSPPTSLPLQASASLATPTPAPCEEPLKLKAPKITLVNTAAFACICRMDGTEVFQLALSKVMLKTGFRGGSDFGFGSYGTWLQLMCCAGLVVRPYISEYPEVRDGRIWS